MSDGITDSIRGFRSVTDWDLEQEIYRKNMEYYWSEQLEKMPIELIEKFLRKKKLINIEPSKINKI